MKRYRIEVGYAHEVKPGNIVGAIANESGLDAAHIGHIDIHNEYSLIDLPHGMPKDVMMDLKKVIVCGQRLRISATDQAFKAHTSGGKSATRKKSSAKKGMTKSRPNSRKSRRTKKNK